MRPQSPIRRQSGNTLAAAALALALTLPLAGLLAWQQHTERTAQANRLALHADRHALVLGQTLQEVQDATWLLGEAIPGRPAQQVEALFQRTLSLTAARRIELVAGGETLVARETGHGQGKSVSLAQRLPADLVPLGPPTITVHSSRIVINQALATGERRFWGDLALMLPMSGLIAASRIDELPPEGYAARLEHVVDAASAPHLLFGSSEPPQRGAAERLVPLPGNGNFRLLVQPLDPPAETWAVAWGILTALGALAFVFAQRLLRRPAELAAEVAARTAQLDQEKVALQREVERRQQMEQLLTSTNLLLDTIFDHLPGMIVLKRASDLRVARINRWGEMFLGRERERVIGRSNEELYPPETAERLTQADQEALASNAPLATSVERLASIGGEERIMRVVRMALPNVYGKPQYILEFGEDITEREGLDRQVREQLNFLEQLIDAIPSPLMFKDLEGRYLGANRAFEALVGQDRKAISGHKVEDVIPPASAEVHREADRKLLREGGTLVYETQLAGPDGRMRDLLMHKALFQNTSGESAGIVGIMLDISENKRAERQINQLNRILTVLSETNRAIVRIGNEDELLGLVADLLHDRGGFPVAWTYLVEGEGTRYFGADAAHADIAATTTTAYRRRAEFRHGGAPYCGSLTACCDEVAARMGVQGLRSLVHLPFIVAGRYAGGIGIIFRDVAQLGAEDYRMLQELADNIAFALDSIATSAARRRVEDQLQLAARVFQNSAEGIIICDARNNILMVNQAFEAMTGYSAAEVIGQNPRLLSSNRQDKAFYQKMWASLQSNGEWHGEIENRRKNGEIYPEWLSLSVVHGAEGAISHYVGTFSDLTKRKEIESRLDFLSNFDPLTALPNRTLFHDRISQALAQAGEGSPLAVMMLDIDRFSRINETIGHQAGDGVLIEVAHRLTGILSAQDSVCRLGGDEFGIILPDVRGVSDAAARATAICEALGQPLTVVGHEIHIATSVGITLYPGDADSVDGLLRTADAAMHSAIANGGNGFCFFQQEMNRWSEERIKVEGRLHHALERGELQVYFQPLVDAESGEIAGAEALLRWNAVDDDSGRQISPAVFIPILEETGLIVKVGEWVLRTACEQQQRWLRETGRTLFVAVNLSALQLADHDLISKVSRIILDTGISAGDLEIELTESAAMRDAEHGLESLNRLKSLGVRLSLDDFGTGYSSLSYLKQLPIDTLKIDRSFVIDADRDREALSIARAIVAIGHALQLEIIAEGIETDAQASLLRTLAVDILQGYRFSRPVPGNDFVALLHATPRFAIEDSDPAGATVLFPHTEKRRGTRQLH
ncbi:MAG: EAL domain-containing protein [Betaproteobacteria bacterium]|nr:EAL domain-containing protein [Betaproteobacteria bacterium]